MDPPVLVYDDDCGFCTWWAEFFAERSDLTLVGFADLPSDLRERLPADYRACSHVVTDERVYSCGASMEQAFARSSVGRPVRPLLDRLNGVGPYDAVREWGYRRAANNRGLLGKLFSKATGD